MAEHLLPGARLFGHSQTTGFGSFNLVNEPDFSFRIPAPIFFLIHSQSIPTFLSDQSVQTINPSATEVLYSVPSPLEFFRF